MTYEDAAKHALKMVDNCIDQKIVCSGAKEIIEFALLKQIPREIEEIHCDEYYCPACGAENNCDQYIVYDLYCPHCGQRINTTTED